MATRTGEKMKLTEGMFIVKFNVIRKFFEALAAIYPECRLHVGKEGIYALVVDSQNREMIEICLNKFKTFIPSKEMTFCLDVSAINAALKTNPPGEDATIRWNNSFIVIETGRVKLSFDFQEDNTVRKDPNPPQLQPGTISFSVLGSVLLQGFLIASAQSDTVWITTTKDSAFLQWKEHRTLLGESICVSVELERLDEIIKRPIRRIEIINNPSLNILDPDVMNIRTEMDREGSLHTPRSNM